MISELFKSKLKEKRSRDLLSSSHPTPTLTPKVLQGSVEHSLESGSRLLLSHECLGQRTSALQGLH